MVQTGATAGILTVLLLLLRASSQAVIQSATLQLAEQYAQPFYAGLACFGSICLFLCGLIWSSRWYEGDLVSTDHTVTHCNMCTIVAPCAQQVCGQDAGLNWLRVGQGVSKASAVTHQCCTSLPVFMLWLSWVTCGPRRVSCQA